MTRLSLKNVTHKESENVDTVRKYFRIYTKDRIFNVYRDFDSEENSNIFSLINFYSFIKFMTYDDTPIYINNKQIVAMEIATYKFPERT